MYQHNTVFNNQINLTYMTTSTKVNNSFNISSLFLEKWKPIFGFEKYYLISTYGRVYSKRYNKLLSPRTNCKEYLRVYLSDGFKSGDYKVHRLVAENFIKKSNLHVNHKDSNKKNNHIDNLEFLTHEQNMIHYQKTFKSKGYVRSKKGYQIAISFKGKRVSFGTYNKELTAIKGANMIYKMKYLGLNSLFIKKAVYKWLENDLVNINKKRLINS